MKRIEVAVGILFNNKRQVLIGQRVVKDDYYQKWEFPGGKLEDGESAESALAREFQEEVGISIKDSDSFMTLDHNYPDRHVRLYVQTIKSYTGNVLPLEGQAIKWVALEELSHIDFLKGNQVIVDELLKQLA